ncbi:methyltransferase domain-containing protein [Janibacter terrae]|jgi:ubiquinone/menaquinone biosynthesis C-methylase UbiE|uniref:Methyltransferase domain-containing protein n=1 Tax=Janibacter terrae TaxID=103817 RepID=A0ABZ2FIZ6_9MICO|nr:class I SAM-dependent methyltransferase [Janibacter terrae]HCE60092.1 methyltransferase domain-containing protein [Janibacter terrae]
MGHDARHDHPGSRRFDDKAATWDDDPDKIRQSGEVAAAIAEAVPLAPRTKLLEYGAGTGLVTIALLESLTEPTITLADNSSGMRQVLADKVADGVLPSPTRVWDLDLEAHPVPSERFDLVVTSNVMHHVHDLDRVLAAFAEVLEDGGHLCIADLDREDGSFHDGDFDGHHGFSREDLATRLGAAGLTEVRVGDAGTVLKQGRDYPVFLAVARKA